MATNDSDADTIPAATVHTPIDTFPATIVRSPIDLDDDDERTHAPVVAPTALDTPDNIAMYVDAVNHPPEVVDDHSREMIDIFKASVDVRPPTDDHVTPAFELGRDTNLTLT